MDLFLCTMYVLSKCYNGLGTARLTTHAVMVYHKCMDGHREVPHP